MRWTGSPKGENVDTVESMEPAEAGCDHRQCKSVGRSPRAGRIELIICPAGLMLYVIHV